MKRLVVILAAAGLLPAQNLQSVVKHGEEVFSQSCGTGYCHAAKGGAGGGAPRLAARGFTQGYIANTVVRGVPNTAMPAFGMSLPQADLAAVIAYVATLNGIANPNLPPIGAASAPAPASAEAARGRQLFSDATRGFARCSACHEVQGIGMPVATGIAKIPADPAALKALVTPNVSTATADGETMPALMIARRTQSVTFYDLSTVPPVLRTVLPEAVQTREGSAWKHSSVITSYSDAELGAILAYLRGAIQ